MVKEIKAREAPRAERSQAENYSLFQKGMAPLVKRYRREPRGLKLINEFWGGFYGVLGDIIGHSYQSPVCNLPQKYIDKAESRGGEFLLLSEDVFTADGLARLSKVFPFRITWTWDKKEFGKIFHSSERGGCVEIETQLNTPFMIPGGRDEFDLRHKIESLGLLGQRLPTYIIGSEFIRLVVGHHFDENMTISRLLGSYYCKGKKREFLSATYNNSGECIDILRCDPYKKDTNWGGRSEAYSPG